MKLEGRQRFNRAYQLLIISCGVAVCLFAALRLPEAGIDSAFLLLVLGTIGISSRISIRIPRVNTNITVSDTLIFLSLMLYGGDAAVLLAACEGGSSGLRISKTPRLVLFNSAAMACSTFVVAQALQLYLALNNYPVLQDSYSHLALATCLMGLVQYVVNSGLVSIGMACKLDQPLWRTWKQYYLWSSISYFAGALAASVLAISIRAISAYMVLAIIPIVAIIYLTYETYRSSLEASTAQAEQAKRHVQELQESEERFRSAFDYAPIGMALVTPEGRWLQVNRSLCEILGYSETELLSTNFQAITDAEDIQTAEIHINELLAGKIASHQMEKRYVHKHGHVVWAFLSISLARDAQDRSLRMIFQIQDITDRKRAQERLAHDASHDTLTGLPNRAHFTERLQRVIERSKESATSSFAVLFLDADRFKVINDSLGHMFGDQLLIGIAERLRRCVRPGDMVARLGGDEFTVLLDVENAKEATLVAERIQKELALPFDLSGREVFTSVSVGIALDIGYKQPQDILRDADTAMYQAKLMGKARYQIFDKEMHSAAMNVLEIETDLRRGVDRSEFCVHYQPIMSLTEGTLRGFEALVRWQHPERGLIYPDEFIRVAEETELIIPIGERILFEACRQVREWQIQFPSFSDLSVSVNLSCKQFKQPGLVKQVSDILRETGLQAQYLHLEITESILMDNVEAAVHMMTELRALGVHLSIDDFGTGYSSLSYLHRFPINRLKIDRSFVSQMHDNNENTEIVRTIVMLARNLGMEVVAEGLETEPQLLKLLVLGCDYGQGYFFCHPGSAATITELLSTSDFTVPITTDSSFDIVAA